MSWSPQVHTVGDPDGVFTGSGVRFSNKEDSDAYAFALMLRWTAVENFRSLETPDDPVTYRVVEDNVVERIPDEERS